MVRAEDFRAAVRSGRRVGTQGAVVYVRSRAGAEPTRFGFIVSKSVGNAVSRNLVRRRLKAIAFDLLSDPGESADVVVRALPGIDQISWATLQGDISDAVRRGVNAR